MSNRYFLLLIGLCICINSQAQDPTIQDCLGAIPVCQAVYSETNSPVGDGNFSSEINTSISCTAGELNSIWYTFTANADGQLGFVITPNNLSDDYDWSLFDITDAECGDIFTDPSLQVSCNAAGGEPCHGATGANGNSVFDEQGGGCNGTPPAVGNTPFNDFVDMEEGRTYVLMVSNWTGSPNGYTIDFSTSSGAGIFDETPPEVDDYTTPNSCNENIIVLHFNENVQCSSVNGDDFVLNGPGGPYSINVTSNDCGLGGDYSRTYFLQIDPPIASMGDFSLALLGSSSNFLDLCGNAALPVNLDFTVDEPIPFEFSIGPDTSLVCEGNLLTLDAEPYGNTFEWDNGSMQPSIEVASAGVYSVTVGNDCGFGVDSLEVFVQTELPTIELGADILLCEGESVELDVTNEFANYEWSDGSIEPLFTVDTTGVFSVIVTNSCGSVYDTVVGTYIPPIIPTLEEELLPCEGEVITLDVDQGEPLFNYLWQDGSTDARLELDKNGVYEVTITSECESLEDQVLVTYVEQHDPPELGPDTLLCPGDSLAYAYDILGAIYQWSDGSTDSAFVINQNGMYALTLTSACGLYEDSVQVRYYEAIQTDLGVDTFLCSGRSLFLNADARAEGSNYLWQNGTTQPYLLVQEPGVYSVEVSTPCETIIDEILVEECEICEVFAPNVFSPNDDGFNDRFQLLSDCVLEDFQMRIFDRWGAVVYESTDPAEGWDGRRKGSKLSSGVYVWWATYTVTENDKPREISETGDISLIK